MKVAYHTVQRLRKLATAEGLTAQEYLLEHPEYKLSQRTRERHGWDEKVLKTAYRKLIEVKTEYV